MTKLFEETRLVPQESVETTTLKHTGIRMRFIRSTPDAPINEALIGRNTAPKAIQPFRFRPSLRALLLSFEEGEETFINVLRMGTPKPIEGDALTPAQTLIHGWDKLTKRQKRYGGLDSLCDALQIAKADAYGWFSTIAFKFSLDISKAQAAVAMPILLESSIEAAKNVANGFEERKMLFQATGFLPVTKGPMVAIQTNVGVNGDGGDPIGSPMPSFEDDQRRVNDVLRGGKHKALPAIDTASRVE